MTIANSRIVIKTSEDSTVVRSRQLPLEIGIVVDTPSGKPNEVVRVNSEAELISAFGEPSSGYPNYDLIRNFLRSYYGVSIVKVPTVDGEYASTVVNNASGEPAITLKGASRSDYENGFGITFKQNGGNLSSSLIRYTESQGLGTIVEVLTGLPTGSLDELVAAINIKSSYITAELIENAEGPVLLDTEFTFENGVRGVVIEPEDIVKSVKKFTSPNVTRLDIVMAPGLYTDDSVVSAVVEVAESRYETSAIVDFSDSTRDVTPVDVLAKVATLPASNKVRYYYPDLVMKLPSGVTAVIPASLAVMYPYAKASMTNIWTAPAGYAEGMSIPAVALAYQLSRDDENKLYEGTPEGSAVNPIIYDSTAGFIINGIRTGGKTGTFTRSITAASMSNHLHYEINSISKMYQYRPNVESTWDAWLLDVNTFLRQIETGGGISDFETFMGTNTMTDEDIRNGILRGVVRVQPTNAIEYIEITVALTNTMLEPTGSQ